MHGYLRMILNKHVMKEPRVPGFFILPDGRSIHIESWKRNREKFLEWYFHDHWTPFNERWLDRRGNA